MGFVYCVLDLCMYLHIRIDKQRQIKNKKTGQYREVSHGYYIQQFRILRLDV